MQKWKAKGLLGRAIGDNQLLYDSYRYLTNHVLKTQKRAPWKWCRWFREHILLVKRFAGINPNSARYWLFDPGWTITPQALIYLRTDRKSIYTEESASICPVYNTIAVKTILENIKTLGKTYTLPEEKEKILNKISSLNAEQSLELLNFNKVDKKYLAAHKGKIDICLSMGRLEHYTPSKLTEEIRRMHSILRTGGAATHIIDHRDHYWHADSSIPVFRHFHFSESQWRRWYHNKLFYINRLVQSDYVRRFEENGFRVVYTGSKPYPEGAQPVDKNNFHPDFQHLLDADLSATVSHIVAIKK